MILNDLAEYAETSIPVDFCRFASTQFAHAAVIPIKVSATFRISAPTPIFRSYTHTFTVRAYNFLQLLGTTTDQNGSANSIITTQSDQLTSSASFRLSPSHKAIPNGTATNETKKTIGDRTKIATVMVALTHGSPQSIGVSNMSEMVSFANDIALWVGQRSVTTPPFNLVFMYACSVLPSTDCSSANGIGPVNKATCGFTAPVAALLWPGSDWDNLSPGQFPQVPPNKGLSDHSDTLMASLKVLMSAGAYHGLDQAVNEANKAYPPVTVNGLLPAKLPMVIQGDGRARLFGVYPSQAEAQMYPGAIIKW